MTGGWAISPGLEDFASRLRAAAQSLNLKVEDRVALAGTSFNGGSTASTSLSPTDLPTESHAIRIDRFNIVLGVLPDVPTLEAVRETLRRYRNLKVEDRVALAGTSFNGGSTASTSLSPTDLPTESHAIRIDRFNIVLGVLPDVPTLEAVRETLRRYRNQCVVARSFLGANETLDLQLMLLGPRSSERQDAWRALALMVERDDRVARKLAWLRPEDPKHDEESFADFLKRTFLARPWILNEREFEDAALDALSSGAATAPGLPRTTADEWERIALNDKKSPDEVVTALVKAWERRGQA